MVFRRGAGVYWVPSPSFLSWKIFLPATSYPILKKKKRSRRRRQREEKKKKKEKEKEMKKRWRDRNEEKQNKKDNFFFEREREREAFLTWDVKILCCSASFSSLGQLKMVARSVFVGSGLLPPEDGLPPHSLLTMPPSSSSSCLTLFLYFLSSIYPLVDLSIYFIYVSLRPSI